MSLKDYFENIEGRGILATADESGNVDVALYARPHVIDDKTVAFIMRERITHQNLKTNHRAAYMFIEKGPGHKGKRLYLTKLREETNTELINQMCRKQEHIAQPGDDSNKYLVMFGVDRVRPLVGDDRQ